jgi:hypothetical protein
MSLEELSMLYDTASFSIYSLKKTEEEERKLKLHVGQVAEGLF